MKKYKNICADGAPFRCRGCDEQFPAHQVKLIAANGQDFTWGAICLDCIADIWGEDWQKTAQEIKGES